ncbi:hypothetical protein KSF78_0004589 [Schistosoma japonicum]|nr:hypothetical protein KSF78_0004589 [Schistosoma japonicum]
MQNLISVWHAAIYENTKQKEVNKTLLREYEDRLDHASTMEKTTMFSVEDHKLLIELSEEKWRSRKDLNEVEILD